MDQQKIVDCYNKTASSYAEKYMNELEHKPLDRILLRAFAEENKAKGRIIDVGCGPGQISRYLAKCNIEDVLGVDLSPGMVRVAQELNSPARFEVADMLAFHYPDGSFGSIIAFYAIVHLGYDYIKPAFLEFNRILMPGGQLLFSFHVGEEIIHQDVFLDQQVDIDFIFYKTGIIVETLLSAGFRVIDIIERQPYAGMEFPSKRAYIWAEKKPE